MVIRTPVALALVAATLAGIPACGTGEGTHGGAASLPSSQIVPYIPLEAPLIAKQGHDYRRPWILEDADGFRLWIADQDVGSGAGDRILTFSSTDGIHWGEGGETVLAADPETWEEGRIGDPSVLQDGEDLLLYYVGGDGAGIGRAIRRGDGPWIREEGPLFVPEAPWEDTDEGGRVAHPSVIRTGDGYRMYYVGGDGAGVGLATSSDGRVWTRLGEEPVFGPSGADSETLWDRDAILSATVSVGTTPTGREIHRMWYGGARLTAGGDLDPAIGFAGSFDGVHWDRFVLAPVLHEGSQGETDAFPIVVAGTPALQYTRYWKKEGTNRRVLALAFFETVPEGLNE